MSISPARALPPPSHCETSLAHQVSVERVIGFMESHPRDRLSLREMADLAIMSPFHFNRVFRQVTGIPPGFFQSALRLQAAKRLLLATPLHQREVCAEVGFESLSTFYRQFKARVGVPPERFRAIVRDASEAFAALHSFVGLGENLSEQGEGTLVRVDGQAGFSGVVVVALFRRSIPEGWPVACFVRAGTGLARLPLTAKGRYYLLAAGILEATDLEDCVIHGKGLLRSHPRGLSVTVNGSGNIMGNTPTLMLRASEAADPPILFAFPALISQPRAGLGSGVADATRSLAL